MYFKIFLLSFVIIVQLNSSNASIQDTINRFSFEFYVETSKLNPDKSLIVSPLSSQIVLGLLSTTAKGNTQTEIFDALHINNTDTIKATFMNLLTEVKNIDVEISNPAYDPEIDSSKIANIQRKKSTIDIVNKIYVKDGKLFELEPDFQSVAKTFFFSDIENIDFSKNEEAARRINNWVSRKTKSKINELFSSNSFDSNTRSVLVNAIYFHGKWKYPFDKKDTKKDAFFIDDSQTVYVDTMHQEEDFQFSFSTELGSRILELPYNSSETSLIILLPNKGNDLKSLEKKIINVNIKTLLKTMYTTNMYVAIPKFKIETSIDLKVPLKKLGIEQMFDKFKADLSGILKNDEQLFVSEAVQKAFIDVNEEGTEAAAASGFKVSLESAPLEFIVNRPFMYLLINKGSIIFCGKYMGN